jgi:hypothetical protein
MPDHDISQWRKREHISLPRALVVGGALAMIFFLPDAWAHWAVAGFFGVFIFVACAIDRKLTGVKGGLGVLATGVLLLAPAYWFLPREAWHSAGKLMDVGHPSAADLFLLGIAAVGGGALLLVWALVQLAWRGGRRSKNVSP